MKIQTTALVKELLIDGKQYPLEDQKAIELEFSAIDTGGGFKDPMLDFSFSVEATEGLAADQQHKLTLTLVNPRDPDNEATFAYVGAVYPADNHQLEINGRLLENKLTEELLGFVMRRLRQG